ncbi:MAG TPA: Hsp20/alpha crystallin family protein [Thermoanaerobaculia bacterium]|jgi:HSP20 family protein|nr:Hsp20/alpha crystallin family protein [Thermoanaerobaculia bacterium]
MARTRSGPATELARLQQRLSKLLEQALLGGGGEIAQGGPSGWCPLLDLVETGDAYILYAELPGVRRSDIVLDSDGHHLELSGQRRPSGGERGYLRLEGSYGPFRRRLELPGPVDAERIAARLRRGILEVVMPKQAPTRRADVALREG